MKNKELETSEFLRYILNVIANGYARKSQRELGAQAKKILGSRKLVLAKSFYSVSQLLDLEINALSEKFFKNHKFTALDLAPTSDNRLKDFLSPHIRDVKEVSTSANIENTRLSRLLSGEFTHLYPNEVYGLAKAFVITPSQLFDYFYGDGERPIVGI